MKLTILKNPYITRFFIEYLISLIQSYVFTVMNERKLEIINDYVNDNDLFYRTSNTKFNAVCIIYYAINNLEYAKIKDKYVIRINETLMTPGFDTRLIDVCKFINYGNSDIVGYPIFTNAFRNIKNNIKTYYKLYGRD